MFVVGAFVIYLINRLPQN